MGAACCVATKDRTIVHGPSHGTIQRHVRYSPSWSLRWDNHGRVAGEETHANWLNDGDARNNTMEVKSSYNVETAFSLEEGSPLNGHRLHCQKSSIADGNVGNIKFQVSGESILRNLVEVKDSAESPSVSRLSPVKLSPLATSAASSLTSKSHLLRPDSTPSRFHRYFRGPKFMHQVPPYSNSEEASAHLPPDWGSESTRGSDVGSSDSWSNPVLSERTATRRGRFSFDNGNMGFSADKFAGSCYQSSKSPSIDLQTCGVCAKVLTERSSWGWTSQKIVSTNELAVVSILNCGHVYHAECLDCMTPEINKFDPNCPVCTYGEKQALKISRKALKAELDLKARKRCRDNIVDSDQTGNMISFNHHKHGGDEARGLKTSSSGIKKNSPGKPFLKRHLSFTKYSKSLPENQIDRRKALFWARSSKDWA